MFKALFFDIDGTLLPFSTHRVSPATVAAFDTLRRRGILTFIATGRPRVLIPDLPLPLDGYVTVNGGHVTVRDRVLLRRPIAKADSLRWLDYVREHDLVTMAFTESRMFVNRISREALAIRDQLDFTMPPLLPLDDLSQETVFQYIALMPSSCDASVSALLPGCRLPRWHPAFSDLIPKDSSKAAGMERVLAHCDVRKEEIMAFGDGANDIEMLSFAGCGVAMGNASDEVKAHADYVTATADDDGIVQALRHFGLLD